MDNKQHPDFPIKDTRGLLYTAGGKYLLEEDEDHELDLVEIIEFGNPIY